MDDLKAKVRRQFGAAADDYATSEVHAQGESLGLLVELLAPQASWKALDVATGAGHTALTLAPRVAEVIALDLTEPMLRKTAALAAERGLGNLSIRAGDAEALPFAEASFDLVTCRLAFHHFPHPGQAAAEFARVLKPGGKLGFTDNFVVADHDAARLYNRFEKLRDPSHCAVYSLAALTGMLETAGIRVTATRELSKEFEFHGWADRQRAPAPVKEELLAILRELPPPLDSFLQPRWADGTAYFRLWEVVVVALKCG